MKETKNICFLTSVPIQESFYKDLQFSVQSKPDFLIMRFFWLLAILGLVVPKVQGKGCPLHELNREELQADPGTTTPNGCQCSSHCGASVGDNFKTDWCHVDEDCGNWAVQYWGHWDYCQYKADSLPDFNQDWKSKHDNLWQQITADPTLGEYNNAAMFTESVITPFTNEWDIMPAGRIKVIHSVGAVCPFEIEVPKDSAYTGILKPGKVTGFIRAGSALDITDSSEGIPPGVGVKFMRSNAMSANFEALFTISPIPDENYNFFAVPLSNHIPVPVTNIPNVLLGKKFCQTGHCITKNGISNLATIDQDGNVEKAPNAPFRVSLEPTKEVQFSEEKPADMAEFMTRFTSIPVGSKMYHLKAHVSPDDDEGIFLGDLVTTDNCVTSHFGDTRMSFKHQAIEEDVALNPQWEEGYLTGCYCNSPYE